MSRRPTGPTQHDRVKAMLEHGWTCGAEFVGTTPPILRYTSRIHELRSDGFSIARQTCAHPWHDHTSQMFQWRIESRPGDPAPLPGTTRP